MALYNKGNINICLEMKRLFFILMASILISCGTGVNVKSPSNNTALKLKPFKLIVYNANYSMAYAVQYVLTNKSLEIIFKGQLEKERDSVLFKTSLQANETLEKLSNINIGSLQEYYSNPCIRDGSQITVKLKKGFKSKMVHLSNYYQPDIGLAIELINGLVPKEYQIWYDKEELIKDMKNCK